MKEELQANNVADPAVQPELTGAQYRFLRYVGFAGVVAGLLDTGFFLGEGSALGVVIGASAAIGSTVSIGYGNRAQQPPEAASTSAE